MIGGLVVLGIAAQAPNVPLRDVITDIPDAVVDLRYATSDNFLHRPVYPPTARCLLVPEAIDRLKVAAAALRARGFRLKLYDCYRPRSIQWEMWRLFPHKGYVADPNTGSNHNRGAAVDVTLVNADGSPVEMPTAFDAFSPAAHQGYAGGSPSSRQNRETLRAALEAAGFKTIRMEWWHYDLPDSHSYPVLDLPVQ